MISNTGIIYNSDFRNGTTTLNGQTPSDSDDCFEYFHGIPQDKVATLEGGMENVQLIGPHQSKDGAIAIKFTENNRSGGAIKFHFYPKTNMFKVETVVDSKCQIIEDYSNIDRGGDKHVLQNWDTLQIRFEGATYELSLGYDAGIIDADFRSVSPKQQPFSPDNFVNCG